MVKSGTVGRHRWSDANNADALHPNFRCLREGIIRKIAQIKLQEYLLVMFFL